MGFVNLTVAVLGTTVLGREVTVRFSTSDLSATSQFTIIIMSVIRIYSFFFFSVTAGSDYNSTVTDLTFSSNVQRIVVRVPILQDSAIEGTEQFRASLSLVQSNGVNVTVSPDQATVKILDDEGKKCCVFI